MRKLQLTTLSDKFLFILIPCLVFSYLPVISLGRLAGMSIEVSFLYALVGVTVIVGHASAYKVVPILTKNLPWLLLGIFIIYCFVSLLWTANPIRGAITSLFFALLFSLATIIASRATFLRKNQSQLQRYLLLTLLAASGWAIWQIIADMLLLSNMFTGLPAMYRGDVFGVARPTGFALEPQFFGSLLIIPLLWSLHELLIKAWRNRTVFIFLLSSIMVLMTLSRGAIIAAVLGLILLLLITRPPANRFFKTLALGLASIIVFLLIVFTTATIRPDSISGKESVNRVVSQLSLGNIDLTNKTPTDPSPAQSPATPIETQTTLSPSDKGYVAESTDSRLSMSARALELWHQSLATILFGVGIGGFGASLHASESTYPISSVVNNYYIELLTETGLIGAMLFTGFIGTLFVLLIQRRAYLACVILLSLLLQMAFFSGNANIVHIWVFIGFCIGLIITSRKPAHFLSRLLQ